MSEATMQKKNEIMASGMSDDLKLFKMIELCSDEIRRTDSQMYYALLGWRDTHLCDLQKADSEYLRSTMKPNNI